VLEELVYRSVLIKSSVVSEDEKEAGLRRILNFGHTLGHALEKLYGYGTLKHGEAVLFGMLAALLISSELKKCPPSLFGRVRDLGAALGLPVSLDSPPAFSAVMDVMKHDKKVRDGKIEFVLLSDMAKPEAGEAVPESLIEEAYGELVI
jgi:3-dehydroquinate synthase